MRIALTIEGLRNRARRRVPRVFFDYLEAGSWDEATLARNCDDLARLRLRQRVAVDVSQRDLTARFLGRTWELPFGLAPIGLAGLQYPDGEIHAAKAAEAANIPYILSTMSVCTIEEVAAATQKPFWFQLYVMRDRAFTEDLLKRAEAAGCDVLVLTLDLPVMGQRHADLRNGLGARRMPLRTALNFASKPRWVAGMLRAKRRGLGNLLDWVPGTADSESLARWVAEQLDCTLDWAEVEKFRQRWKGKFVLKGILNAEDAKHAARIGADAIIVSNHGGRQLDGAGSSISLLPEIAAAISGPKVFFDSGIRCGQDVLKALALGAHGVFVGRAYVYGLAANGYDGVARSIDILRNELDLSMALTGNVSAERIDPGTVQRAE